MSLSTNSASALSPAQRLVRCCAAMHPALLTACFTTLAIVMAIPIGLLVWEVLTLLGKPSLPLMLGTTALIVAVPLAGFLAFTVAWGWAQRQSLFHKDALLVSAQRMAKLGHWRLTLDSDHYLLSEEICPMFGVSPENPRLEIGRLFELIHPDDQQKVRDALHLLTHEHRPQEIEYRLRDPDGHYRTVWVDGRCEYDSYGHVVSFFGVIQDITERKAIENDLRRALEHAEEANRAKSEFLASMSHELRTPLNAVLGFSEMIRDQRLGPVSNPRYVEYAGDIHDSGTHLLSLINGLLDVSKIEAGRYELYEEKVNLCSVVNRAIHTVQPVAAQTRKIISVSFPEPDLVIMADKRALYQMLLNLLSNAIKFSHLNGLIAVRIALDMDWFTIAVEDHGIGIPEDKIARVGQPFFQAHAAKTGVMGGTGIGLSVTRSLAELHGGKLTIVSRYGEGTTATIYLPRHRVMHGASVAA